jgi:hypothetical protein
MKQVAAVTPERMDGRKLSSLLHAEEGMGLFLPRVGGMNAADRDKCFGGIADGFVNFTEALTATTLTKNAKMDLRLGVMRGKFPEANA